MGRLSLPWFLVPRLGGYSLLGLLNLIFVQWFFMRIEARLHEDGRVELGLLGFVLPLSGWGNAYLKLGATWRVYPLVRGAR